MLGSSLKLALRTLCRDKLYASVNIAGLALAITCCLILGLYLRSELTYDRHHVQHERIFRIANAFEDLDTGNQHIDVALTSPALGPLLADDFADVEAFVRVRPFDIDPLIRHGDDAFYWQQVFFADDNIFDVFTHEILYGDPRTALVEPSSVAVSETFASRYFGDANPVGEIVTLENGDSREISLVFADLPDNSHLKYDVLFSYNEPSLAIPERDIGRWLFGVNTYSYVLLPLGYDPNDFGVVSSAFFERYMADLARQRTNRAWNAWLQPLADVHLGANLRFDEPTGNRFHLYGFGAVAIFILVIACINYMNLATARAARRAKEIGMRKTLGAGRTSLALQFLSESIALSLVAFGIGVLLVPVVLGATPIGELLGKPLATLNAAGQAGTLSIALGLSLAIGVAAGLYPAFYLSAIAPLSALVPAGRHAAKNPRLRELLVLVQFTISVGVIACTLVMALQMRFIATQSLGFDRENRVLVTLRGQDVIEQIPVLENELAKNPRVLGVSSSAAMMGQEFNRNSTGVENNDGVMQPVQVHHMAIADDFVDVMGMEVAAGRNFSRETATDAAGAVLVNEALVRQMGWGQSLGKRIRAGQREAAVIGVVKDFNFKSLHTTVEPFVMYLAEFLGDVPAEARAFAQRELVVNVTREDVPDTIAFIERTVGQFTTQPFEYRFLDAALDALYLSEQRLMRLVGLFSGICIFIACLGLFGLAAYTTEQRTREIGIRKVLGATKSQIIDLLARKTLVLVLAGAIAATVLAYPAMDAWLASFAYRTVINPLLFVLSAAVGVAVAYTTVAVQSLRVVRAHPIEALRHE